MIVVFIDGKYTDDTKDLVEKNITKAKEMAKRLLELNICPICPHTIQYDWEDDPRFEWGDFMDMNKALLSKSDALLLLDNWQTSKETKLRKEYAEELNIPVFESLKDLMRWYLRSDSEKRQDAIKEQLEKTLAGTDKKFSANKESNSSNKEIEEAYKHLEELRNEINTQVPWLDVSVEDMKLILKFYFVNLILDLSTELYSNPFQSALGEDDMFSLIDNENTSNPSDFGLEEFLFLLKLLDKFDKYQ